VEIDTPTPYKPRKPNTGLKVLIEDGEQNHLATSAFDRKIQTEREVINSPHSNTDPTTLVWRSLRGNKVVKNMAKNMIANDTLLIKKFRDDEGEALFSDVQMTDRNN
jgi:hypothetical protein